jgi:tetratricopeptide (TPR) repeat protein
LADAFLGDALRHLPAEARARQACEGKRALIVVDTSHPWSDELEKHLSVLDKNSVALILSHSAEARPEQPIRVTTGLDLNESKTLLGRACGGKLPADTAKLLELATGHPYALALIGSLLASGDDAKKLAADWAAADLPPLIDAASEDTSVGDKALTWLFARRVQRTTDVERKVLEAAGTLAHAPFPLAAMTTAVGETNAGAALGGLVSAGFLAGPGGVNRQWRLAHNFSYWPLRQNESSPETRLTLRDRLIRWLGADVEERVPKDSKPDSATIVDSTLLHLQAVINDQDVPGTDALDIIETATDRLNAAGCFASVETALIVLNESIHRIDSRLGRTRLKKAKALAGIGAGLQMRGDLAGGLRYCEEARSVLTPFLAQPRGANKLLARRRLIDVLNRIASIYDRLDDLAAVEKCYAEALNIVRDKVFPLELLEVLRNYADVRQRMKDYAGALALLEEGRDIAVEWLATDPQGVRMRLELGSAHVQIADLWRERGDMAKAEGSFDDAIQVLDEINKLNPGDPYDLARLGSLVHQLGYACFEADKLDQALTCLEQARMMRARLVEVHPDRRHAEWGLSMTYRRLVEVHEARENTAEAVRFATLALEIDERLAAADPNRATWVNQARESRDTLARLRGKLPPA